MERLEAKKISGHTYYYYSDWGWVNGKCRRRWQRYLGKLEDIVKACEGCGPAPLYADVFQWGLPAALWKEALTARIVEEINALCPKDPRVNNFTFMPGVSTLSCGLIAEFDV